MALRDIIAFPYLPTEVQFIGYAGGTYLDASPLTIYNGVTDTNGLNIQAVDDANGRWLKIRPKYGTASGGVNKTNCIAWSIGTQYSLLDTGVYYYGYRFMFVPGPKNGTSIWLGNLLTIYNGVQGFATNLLSPAEAGLNLANGQPGVEIYVEVRVDFPNKSCRLWVDGKYIKDISFDSRLLANNSYLLLGDRTSNGATPLDNGYYDMYLRDFYFKEVSNAQDDFRLGPQIIDFLDVGTVDAAGWTTNGSDIKTSLNTPVSTVASKATPVITSDAGKTPAVIKYTPKAKGSTIMGVFLTIAGNRLGGTSGNLQADISQDSTAGPSKTVVLPTTLVFNQPIAVLEKDLSGTVFTDTTVGKLTLKLSPK